MSDDPELAFLGAKKGTGQLQDINSNSGCGVGAYKVPSEFSLEAKILTPSYALEPASPSSDIDPSSITTATNAQKQHAEKEFEFDHP